VLLMINAVLSGVRSAKNFPEENNTKTAIRTNRGKNRMS
jgi:hypothetical protein